MIASGFFASRAWARPISSSRAVTSAGTSSRRTKSGAAAAMCMARSFTRVWKPSVRATKSVSQFTSTRTPILPPMWM